MTVLPRERILNFMNDDTINDLKQFIAATVSQQVSDVRADIQRLDDKLTGKIDDMSASVAEALEATNESYAKQFDDHEQRISRLEQVLFSSKASDY